MRFLLAALLLTLPAAAQVMPFPKVSEYLGLRPDQVENLLKNIQEASRPDPAKLEEMNRLRREIAEETAKPSPSAIELGERYLRLELICRELRDRSADVGKENLALLDAAQREKLKALEAQLPLMQVLSEAMALRLLTPPAPGNIIPAGRMISGSITSAPTAWFDTARFQFDTTDGAWLGGFGCAVPMTMQRATPVPMPIRNPMPGMNRR